MSDMVEFLEFCLDKLEECAKVWEKANADYGKGENCTFNFDTIAEFMSQNNRLVGISSYDVACVYLMKHIFSITKGKSGRESLSGRFTDAHNYLFIMEWMHQKDAEAAEAIESFNESTVQESKAAQHDWHGNPLPYIRQEPPRDGRWQPIPHV